MPDMLTDSRRNFLKKLATFPTIIPALSQIDIRSGPDERRETDIKTIKKIDLHTHISSDADYLREVMNSLNLKMFTICNEGLKVERLKSQVDAAINICKKYPRYYAWCTTFGFDRMYETDWPDRVTETLKEGFRNGALAAKVWKEIGMEVKDTEGRFVQIDDPVFDPILEYISKEGIPLFTHIGDPVQLWLSTEQNGKRNGWYEEGAGFWNRIGKFRGEVSYDELILARDRMISKHKNMKVIGCHMGSMGFDVDLVAERLERYPNFAVETSSTLSYLMDQEREKLRSFFTRYQDRIMYATDISGGMIATPYLVDMSMLGTQWTPGEVVKQKNDLLKKYRSDFTYFATNHKIERNGYSIVGLDLPDDVLNKMFYKNALNWVPGIDKNF